MRVIGLDPGYNRLGVAVVLKNGASRETVEFSTCLVTPKTLDLSKRLLGLGREFGKILKKYRPELAAMEKLFLGQNQKTAMAVAETRGMLKFLIADNRLPLVEYAPQEIKLCVTGYGRSDKRQVKNLVYRLTNLDDQKRSDDEIDAVAVALTALARQPVINT